MLLFTKSSWHTCSEKRLTMSMNTSIVRREIRTIKVDSFNSFLPAIYCNFLVEDILQQLQIGVWRFQQEVWLDHPGQPWLSKVLDAWCLLPGRTEHDQTFFLFPKSFHAALQEWHFGHKSKVCSNYILVIITPHLLHVKFLQLGHRVTMCGKRVVSFGCDGERKMNHPLS